MSKGPFFFCALKVGGGGGGGGRFFFGELHKGISLILSTKKTVRRTQRRNCGKKRDERRKKVTNF